MQHDTGGNEDQPPLRQTEQRAPGEVGARAAGDQQQGTGDQFACRDQQNAADGAGDHDEAREPHRAEQ